MRYAVGSISKQFTAAAILFLVVQTDDGKGTHYGLGVEVHVQNGHKHISHDGEVSGFAADNVVIPDTKTAIVVLTNQDAMNAADLIAASLEPILAGRLTEEERALAVFTGLQNGTIDRARLTPACNAYFSQEAAGDFATSLKPLGEPISLTH